MGHLYWNLLPPTAPTIALPNPNGYDEIVLAGKGLNWAAIPNQGADEAGMDACRAFVQVNAAPLARLRRAFAMPCRNPVVFDAVYRFIGSNQEFRSVARALVAEATLATAEGRHADAMNSNVDILRLAPAVANGGIGIDDLVGDAIASVGMARLVSQLPQLGAPELKSLAEVLDTLREAREPIESIEQRDLLWDRLSYSWIGRYWAWSDDVAFGDAANASAFADARRRCDALCSLIMTEAAVRRYVIENGSPPESLAALVPEYLPTVPVDPYGDAPLRYRRTEGGYLLYSIGANGVDDGGQHVNFSDATTNKKGDLFFDASMENEAPTEDASARVTVQVLPSPSMGEGGSGSDAARRCLSRVRVAHLKLSACDRAPSPCPSPGGRGDSVHGKIAAMPTACPWCWALR